MSLYLELGNTRVKLAERRGSTWKQEWFEDRRSIVKRLRGCAEPVIALAAPARQEWLNEIASVCTVRQITREPLRDFIGESYDTPETLGLDRVLNLLGLTSDGVVISCGTAITVDALLGGTPRFGAIMPGIRTAAEGLHNRIPTLPLVEPWGEPMVMEPNQPPLPKRWLPARSSEQSVWNGVVMGTVWGAAALAGELWTVCGGEAPAPVTLTGGDLGVLHRYWPLSSTPLPDPDLLFRGMERVAPWL